jgi:hypothetical protein
LNEFDDDRDHDRRGELAETDTLGRLWGSKEDGAVERRGEEEENGRRRRRRIRGGGPGGVEGKRKELKEVSVFLCFHHSANNKKLIIFF